MRLDVDTQMETSASVQHRVNLRQGGYRNCKLGGCFKTWWRRRRKHLDVFNDVKLTATPKGSRQSMNPYIYVPTTGKFASKKKTGKPQTQNLDHSRFCPFNLKFETIKLPYFKNRSLGVCETLNPLSSTNIFSQPAPTKSWSLQPQQRAALYN
jgi:hypothetical protein